MTLGIQCVNGLRQIQRQRLVRVKPSGLRDQVLGQGGEDAPVACGQGVGERAAFDRPTQSQVIKLAGARVETSFDVAQTFAPGQLRKDQTNQLLPAGEMFDLVVAAITLDAALEHLWVNGIEELIQNELTGEHGSRIAARGARKGARNSSRSHSQNAFPPS
jgi:hypothetical protein